MDPDISDLNDEQRQALLDLLVLAQYLDRHLESGEDDLLNRLLTAMGCQTTYDRERRFDAAVTRVRPYAETSDLTRHYASKLAKAFRTTDQCRRVFGLIERLITCDGQVTPEEQRFLELLRDTFQL